jgi:hypothetical protein
MIRARLAPRGSLRGIWIWPPRSPGCRTGRVHVRPGRAGRWGPGRRSRRRPAGPARSGRPGPRAVAGVRAGRTRPAGRAVPVVRQRCVRPARARRRYRRPGRLPPGRHRYPGSARPRRRTGRNPGIRRFPCLEDARAYARHRDRVLAVARAEPQQAAQQVAKRNWSGSTTRTYNRRSVLEQPLPSGPLEARRSEQSAFGLVVLKGARSRLLGRQAPWPGITGLAGRRLCG